MTYKIVTKYKYCLPGFCFLGLVFLDIVQGQWQFYHPQNLFALTAAKAVIILVLTLIALKKSFRLPVILLGLGLSFLIGYSFQLLNFDNLRMLLKYLSVFIYFYAFKTLLNTDKKRRFLIKCGLFFIYLGIVSIVLGLLFHIDGFQTYVAGRFGYKGLLKRSIDASYFIMFAGLWVYFFRKDIKKYLILLIAILIVIPILGTKLPFLFLGMVVVYLLFKSQHKVKLFALIGAILLGMGTLIFLLIPLKLKATLTMFFHLYQEQGFWTSITSFRSDLLLKASHYYAEHWTWVNYLFGGRDSGRLLVEMAVPDLLIFFGLVGSLFFAIFYAKTYFRSTPSRFKIGFGLVLICGALAGQFLFNTTASLWFAALAVLVQSRYKKSSKMKVFLISNMYPSKKTPTYGTFVFNVVKSLKKWGVRFSHRSVIRGKSTSKLKNSFRYLFHYIGIAYHYVFDDFKVVYVHFISHHTPILYLLMKIFGKKEKLCINIHGSDIFKSRDKKIDIYNAWVLQRADLIVVPSAYLKNIMRKQYPDIGDAVYHISPSGGIDPEVFYPPQNPQKEKNIPEIGFISRIVPGKGWDIFLESLYQLKQQQFEFHATMIGRGSQIDQLKQKITQLDLDHEVEFIDAVPQQELARLYHGFDVFVFSSTLPESLGLVGLEAMACQVPVIGSKMAGVETYLEDQLNGLFFNPGDAGDLAEKIGYFFNLPAPKRQNMKSQALRTAKQYDKNKVTKQLYLKMKALEAPD